MLTNCALFSILFYEVIKQMTSKRNKKVKTITGISIDPDTKLTVQKSLPLMALWRSELTLAEFKILDAYLSRIDSRTPEKRAVRFEKGELEALLGVKKINTPELKERLKHLGTMVQVDDPTKTRSFRLIALFEQAECEQDEYGQWQVELECTQKAMKYIFNVEDIGYLRYKLRSIVNLSSRYSYILFLYLEFNRFRKTWEIGLDDLKQMLRCDDEETYKEFKRFNDRLLKRCQKEIHEKTECRFTYEPVKRGRSVVAVRFAVETLPSLEVPDQLSLAAITTKPEDQIEFLRSACTPSGAAEPEFSREEMEQLFEVLVMVEDSVFPYPKDMPYDIEFRRYHYLRQKYTAMNCASTKKPIKHRFSYLLKMVRKDSGVLAR